MHRLTRESARQLLAAPLALLCALVPGRTIVKMLVAWDIYASVYLVLTLLAFRGRRPEELRAVTRVSRRLPPVLRAFVPRPEQLSQGAAAYALVATVIAMPQARSLGTSPALVLGVCVVAVLSSWLTLQTGFAIAYLSMYAETGGLSFPGDEEPTMVDFAYFAVAVGTTFGTTDVEVTQSRMRRNVLVHGVLAFFFNTLILAVAVTIVTSYIAGG